MHGLCGWTKTTPFGLAWRDGAVLLADQDGIWEVPHRLGAVRLGAGGQNTLARPTCRWRSRRSCWWPQAWRHRLKVG